MSPLRERRFRRLWIAGLISDTGDWLLLVSLPILVYEYTHSTIGTAAAFLVELAPPVLLAPLAGRIADRSDRRRILAGIPLAQAAALTPLLLVAGRSGLPVVYGVVVAQSALAAVFDPTKNALLPTLVDPDRLLSANSLVALNQNVGRLIGGSLGGALLAVGGGLSVIVVADGASFLLAAGLIASLAPARAAPGDPRAPDPPTPDPTARDGGWALALRPPEIRAGLLVLLIASVAQGIFAVLYIVFAARVLHGGSGEIGLLRGVQAVGAIAAALPLALARRISPRALTASAAVAFGLLDLAIWNLPHLTLAVPVYVGLFVVVGAPGTALVTGLTSALQQASADGRRGRTFAAAGVATSVGQAAGMIAAGLLADRLGVVNVLNAQGTLYLLAGLVAAVWLGRPGRIHGRPAPAAASPGSARPSPRPAD
ncbi:MAG TPA: MFS transporter [Solirubrobacteraceae bacterium]